jgi:hypothetical protein
VPEEGAVLVAVCVRAVCVCACVRACSVCVCGMCYVGGQVCFKFNESDTGSCCMACRFTSTAGSVGVNTAGFLDGGSGFGGGDGGGPGDGGLGTANAHIPGAWRGRPLPADRLRLQV